MYVRLLALVLCLSTQCHGDCQLDAATLTGLRLQAVQTFGVLSGTPPTSFQSWVDNLKPLFTQDAFLFVPETGIWSGIDLAVEYLALGNTAYNLGSFAELASVPLGPPMFPGTDIIQLVSFNRYVVAQGRIFKNATVTTTFTFPPCSQQFSAVNITGFGEVIAATLLSIPSFVDTCVRIQNFCNGSLQQFGSLEECATYLTSLPRQTCTLPIVGGNTNICRTIHSLLVPYVPQVHCPHTGRYSVPCSDTNCMGLLTPPSPPPPQPAQEFRVTFNNNACNNACNNGQQ